MSEEPTKNQPTIHEALAAVMAEVEVVGKDRLNRDQNFKFRGIDAVVNAVGPAFRNAGVFCVPTAISYDVERYTTRKNTEMKNVSMMVGFRFYGPTGDYVEAVTYGEAADAGDKAISKAHSVAFRTALLQTLCIPTGDEDPDATAHERVARRVEGPTTPVPKGWAEIEQAIKACDNADEAWALFLAFTRDASYFLFGKTESSELEPAQRDTLYQKAAGAVVWLMDNRTFEMGELYFYDRDKQRQAWMHVLDGHELKIPDYVPPEPPLDPKAEAEAARIAAEVFAEAGDAAPETAAELAAEDSTPTPGD